MTDHDLLAWPLIAAVAVLVVFGLLLSELRAVWRRRGRRARYRRASREAPPQGPRSWDSGEGISRERVALISTDAQAAASRVARGDHASNPHPARTREFVLWEATFHSALSDFAALEDEGPHAHGPNGNGFR